VFRQPTFIISFVVNTLTGYQKFKYSFVDCKRKIREKSSEKKITQKTLIFFSGDNSFLHCKDGKLFKSSKCVMWKIVVFKLGLNTIE